MSNINWYVAKTPVKPNGKIRRKYDNILLVLPLDNLHEKPFKGKIMDKFVSLIVSKKPPVGKIGNKTHAYVHITSLKTLTRNLVSKTGERKKFNMMLVQVNI